MGEGYREVTFTKTINFEIDVGLNKSKMFFLAYTKGSKVLILSESC